MLADRLEVEAGRALGLVERRDERAEAGLRGEAGERIHRRVDRVDAGLDRGEHRRGGKAGRVVRVEMERRADFLAERREERAAPRRASSRPPCPSRR